MAPFVVIEASTLAAYGAAGWADVWNLLDIATYVFQVCVERSRARPAPGRRRRRRCAGAVAGAGRCLGGHAHESLILAPTLVSART